MTIFCPRCGSRNDEHFNKCAQCDLPLGEVAAIVEGGGASRFWIRLLVTLSLFVLTPWLVFKIGERVNRWFYDFFAGFLLVLLLPGLPWAVSAVLKRVGK